MLSIHVYGGPAVRENIALPEYSAVHLCPVGLPTPRLAAEAREIALQPKGQVTRDYNERFRVTYKLLFISFGQRNCLGVHTVE